MNEIDKKRFKAMMIPFILILVMEVFFRLCIGGYYNFEKGAVIFEIILIYDMTLLWLSITKKFSKAILICSITILFVLIINQLKISVTGEPLYFSDINFIGQTAELVTMVSVVNIVIYIIPFFAIISILILIVKYSKEVEFEIKNTKKRIIIFISSITVLLLLFVPNDYTKKLYLEVFLGTSNLKDYQHYTTNYSYYSKYGVFAGMYGVMLNNRFQN